VSAVAHLNSVGVIHRDVHPTRLHMHNGILKFNMIGLPYNFKKLLKRPNFSGHVNYSAPEFIHERINFGENSDTWSLGCCLYYLVTKQDPFEGRSVPETKKNILNLRLDRHNALGRHDKIFSTLIYKCLERDPHQRLTPK
jgi:eukaryotic-like serine/threonine-protein kinase